MIQILKKSTLALATLFAAVTIVGCNEEAPDYANVVDPNTGESVKTIEAGPDETIYYVSVAANNWSANSDSDWCVFSKSNTTSTSGSNDESLGIIVNKVGTENRVANVLVTSGYATHRIVVQQYAFDDYIELSASNGCVNFDDTEHSFSVTSNITDWYALSNSTDWVTINSTYVQGEQLVLLDVKKNENYDTRVAEISIVSPTSGLTATYVLVQGGSDAGSLSIKKNGTVVSATSFIANSAPEQEFTMVPKNIAGNITYTVSSSDESWCDVSKTGDMFTVKMLSDNTAVESRYAVVTVVAKSDAEAEFSTTSQLVVAQLAAGAPELTLNSETFDAYQAGNTGVSVPYYGKGSVTAQANSDWVSITSTVDNLIVFNVDENSSSESRTATITVIAHRGGDVVITEITLYQDGLDTLDLQIANESIELEARGVSTGDTTLTISATTNTAGATISYLEPSAAWCVQVVDETNKYTVTENLSSESRECHIAVKVTAGGETSVKFVKVTQKGADK